MIRQTANFVQSSLQSLKTHRMRTFLTILGISIGIASIVTILSLADGVNQSIARQTNELGGTVAVVRPSIEASANSFSTQLSPQSFNNSTLTPDDVTTVREAAPNAAVAPLMSFTKTITSGSDKVSGALILSTTEDLPKTTSLDVADGDFFADSMQQNTAVIGSELSMSLFGNDESVGAMLNIGNDTFTIVGVLKKQENTLNYNDVNFNNALIVQLSAADQIFDGRGQIQQINVRADSPEQLATDMNNITTALTESHDAKDFVIISDTEIARPTNDLFNFITKVMAILASVSLLVGGIGIMNIMLVNVGERTREIGIRKSVGASNGSIIGQFLTESLIMSLSGGILGVILGIIVAFSIGSVFYITPGMSWKVSVASLALSIITGTIFGLYPAIRASKKDPIESLRHR